MNDAPGARPRPLRRALLLAASAALGVGIGAAGQALTQHDAWYLAVPACVALAWLAVADPTRCARDAGSDERR